MKTALTFLTKNKGKIAVGLSLAALAGNYAAGTVTLSDAFAAALQLLNTTAP